MRNVKIKERIINIKKQYAIKTERKEYLPEMFSLLFFLKEHWVTDTPKHNKEEITKLGRGGGGEIKKMQ